MDLNHLHLHVRDRRRAADFYREWFGLTVEREFDGLTFLSDSAGFDLALMEDAHPEKLPAWFHFGFRIASAEEVVDLCRRMGAAGVPLAKALYRDATLASFRCQDPDGYPIEVYWEDSVPERKARPVRAPQADRSRQSGPDL
jgi:catechol 2,3-dioxygenase-like lactoylglutathione lyase family enzyme